MTNETDEAGTPAMPAQLDPRARQSIEHLVDARRRSLAPQDLGQAGAPRRRDRRDAALEDGAIEADLSAEIVGEQRELHAGGGRDLAHRNAVDAVRREQPFGRVEDALLAALAVVSHRPNPAA